MTTDSVRRSGVLARPSTADTGPLSYAIFALARAHQAYAAELLRELALHPGQELLLMQLFDRDHQTQSELLRAVGLDHSTVSKSLRRMQDAGLLTRCPAEHDRRVLVVSLTERGSALRGPLGELWRLLEAAAVEGLSERDRERFVAIARTAERTIMHHRADAPGTPDS